jgi:Asp-tRNA(Asn)/Glu-tRNA(Gln) amidotransferase A subunit family amidase
LGVPQGPYLDRASPQGLRHFQGVCKQLAAAGYKVKEVRAMPDFDQIVERHNNLLAAEAAQVHAEWFARYDHLYHAKTAALITRGKQVPQAVVAEARAGRERLRRSLTELMEDNGLDLWIAPAAPGAAPEGLESTGDPVMNLPWTHSGMPAISIPAGADDSGLPLGLQCVGRWRDDEALLTWAQEIEAELS